MKFQITQENPACVASSLLLVGSFEGDFGADGKTTGLPEIGALSRLNQACGGALGRQALTDGYSGKAGQTLVHFTDGRLAAPRLIVFGLGAKERFGLAELRRALTAAFKKVKTLAVSDVTVVPFVFNLSAAPNKPDASLLVEDAIMMPQPVDRSDVGPRSFGENVALYAGMLDYVINHAKTKMGGRKRDRRLEIIKVAASKELTGDIRRGLMAGRAIARAVNRARDLSNEPAGSLTPHKLGEAARKVAANSDGLIKVRVLGRGELRRLGASALLAVNQGSAQKPVLIEMTYTPPTGSTSEVLGFVGKSITFDSGGLDLKTAEGMRTMKRDMAGGASVLAAIGAVAALKLPVSVKAVMAATENMPDGNAYKPGDVIGTLKGLTVEIDNTDAEGRLTLADAIEYAKRRGVTRIIDLATLTGAVRSIAADVGAAAFGNNPEFSARVVQSAEAAGERLVAMPMWPEFREQNHSDMADLKNSGGDPGSITAAWFLREFAGEEIPWVHLDIAGPSYRTRELGPDPKGCTGYGVRTLVELARSFCR